MMLFLLLLSLSLSLRRLVPVQPVSPQQILGPQLFVVGVDESGSGEGESGLRDESESELCPAQGLSRHPPQAVGGDHLLQEGDGGLPLMNLDRKLRLSLKRSK